MKRLSLAKKILLAFNSIAFIGIITGAGWFFSVRYVDKQYSQFVKVNQAKLDAVRSMVRAQQRQRAALNFIGAHSSNSKAVEEEKTAATEQISNFESALKEYKEFPPLDGEADVAKKVDEDWSKFRAVSESILKAASGGNGGKLTELISTDLYNISRVSTEALDKLVDMNESEGYTQLKKSVEIATLASRLAVGVPLAAFIISFLVATLFTMSLRRSLDGLVVNLAENSSSIEDASSQVAQSAERLAQASTQQASSLQETAASAQELTQMVQRNMENAQRSSSMTSASQETAQKGQRVVQEMSKAIGEINTSNADIMNQVNESNRQISEITKVIAEIGNKTKIINDIVFQTKLLSFNASVEAARAGEHGKGFAVVAEEVGNLARMSGTAAKEISDMLNSSIEKVDSIVRDTKTNVERLVQVGKVKVEAGTRIADECAAVLEDIVSSVAQVTQMSQDIANASNEQAQGVREIGNAVELLDRVTDSNAGAAEQAARAADQLSDQAKSLKSSVDELLLMVNGQQKGEVPGGDAHDGPSGHEGGAKSKRSHLKVVSSSVKNAVKSAVGKAASSPATLAQDDEQPRQAAGAES